LLQHTCQVLMPCLEEEIGRGVEFLDVHSFLFFLFLSFFFTFTLVCHILNEWSGLLFIPCWFGGECGEIGYKRFLCFWFCFPSGISFYY
jgi:hypothetical protein